MPLWRILIPCLLAALLLSACFGSERRQQGKTDTRRVIASVNNEPIYYQDFLNEFQLHQGQWEHFIGASSERKWEVQKLVLENMVEDLLLDQTAKEKRVVLKEEAISHQMASLLGMEEATLPSVARNPVGRHSVWENGFARRLLHMELVKQEVTEKISISLPEQQAYYEAHKKDFVQPEQVNVRHIALGSKESYNRVWKRLNKKEKFEDLVQQYSITPDRQFGGLLGYMERGVLPKEFDDAIFRLKKPGSLSSQRSPVHTQIGYHIFRLEGRKPKKPLSFEEAQPSIIARMREERQPAAYKSWLENLKRGASITIKQHLLRPQPS